MAEVKGLPRRCGQCQNAAFAHYPANVDFCRQCNAPPQPPLSFEQVLLQKINAGTLIFQRPSVDLLARTTAGELKFYGFNTLSKQNPDGSIDVTPNLFISDTYSDDPNNRAYLGPPVRLRFRSWLLDGLKIKHTYNEYYDGQESIYDILRA